MNTRKTAVLGLIAVLLTLAFTALSMTGCEQPTDTTTVTADITYTAVQTGGEDGTANTTGIAFTFSASVTGLTADHISVTSGNGSLTKGALSGSGTSWTLGVTVITPGNVTVAIDKSGIEAEPKDVTVFMEGQAAPTLVSISAVYTQGSTIIYPNTPIDSLKADLTVTATYNTGAPQQVTAYELSGTLTVGTSTVTVTYGGKETTFTVNVTAPAVVAPTITITSLPDGIVGTPYSQTLTATGDAPITWSIETGALPTGLTLSTAGEISGTPSAANTFNFTVKAANSAGSGTKQLSITIMSRGGDGSSRSEAIRLTENQWADGNITTADAQWFVFTATASTQWIHADFGTMNTMYVRVHNSGGTPVAEEIELDQYNGISKFEIPLTAGQTYYISVRSDSYYNGTYRIGFNTTSLIPPAIPLTENMFADGILPAFSSQQWFTFTATSDTQYIHFEPGTLSWLWVSVYDSSGEAVGSGARLDSSSNKYTSISLTEGQTYSIRTSAVTGSYNGTTYKIGFTTSTAAPNRVQLPSNAIPLTENQWADGNLPTPGDVQWFTFTATAPAQYIHVEPGTLTYLYVQVYDNSGTPTESESNSSDSNSISQFLTEGDTYYIRVRPYSSSYSGAYRIQFNTTPYPPGTTVTTLTANQWADGDLLTSSDVQWFSFTATASTQFIHAAGTLMTTSSNGIYVQVYSGTAVGSETRLYIYTGYTSLSLTEGQTYYIKVRPYGYNSSGDYLIAFNATPFSPGVTSIPLTENQWADGNLPTSSDVQWFSFTATASTQYIHIDFGTLTDLGVQVYNSSGTTVGSEIYLSNSTTSTSLSLTSGQTYYIRVRPATSTGSGTYQIGFNASIVPPGVTSITLTANQWADGNLPTPGDLQWFTFTATSDTQYIHVSFGTLNGSYGIYVQVFTSSGTTVGNETRLYGSTPNTSLSLTEGQTYYIRVRPFGSSGTYRIGFNASTAAPNRVQLPSNAIPLTENQWADGDLPTSNDVQWFSFTATSDTQYIHFALGTLGIVYVQVYNSSGATVGSETNLYSSTASTSRSLTEGDTYYIRVWPYNNTYSGTYRIGFNATFYPPGINPSPLTANVWADGSLSSGGQEWFSFTATASTQRIHFSPGTLSSVRVQVYDSSGATVGSETSLSSSTTNTSRTLAEGDTYYIRVMPYGSGTGGISGTYRIGFNTTPYPPGTTVTTLTENQWADGNLPTSSSQEWFSFTATASTQYLHVSFGTLSSSDGMYVQVYDSSDAVQGSETTISSLTRNTSRTLTEGDTYYIRVRPYSGSYSGTYRIGFNTTFGPPGVIPLTENQWADGSLSSGGQEWFSFTATASTQYIHVSFGTLTDMLVHVYNSGGAAVGSSGETRLNSPTVRTSRTLTAGQTYYIRVRPYGSSGDYRIGFNRSTTAPNRIQLPSNAIQLTENQWADGNLLTSSGVQYFTFTATASTQYIHVSFGTLTDLYVQVYNSSGAAVGSETRLYGSTTRTSRTLTEGETYYIRVRPYSSSYSGTYRIGFTASTTAPTS